MQQHNGDDDMKGDATRDRGAEPSPNAKRQTPNAKRHLACWEPATSPHRRAAGVGFYGNWQLL
ncbi:hypothetical protein EYF80_067764 [Liparis tanakae]|uniref:Uncharacterized protein n=1 Tax=Liparis tanakae TaxID=230148 RepID=A0A4Z2E034_9TELE|nr:hypothetical protein EYF80_067764 [Liparis tanakae]